MSKFGSECIHHVLRLYVVATLYREQEDRSESGKPRPPTNSFGCVQNTKHACCMTFQCHSRLYVIMSGVEPPYVISNHKKSPIYLILLGQNFRPYTHPCPSFFSKSNHFLPGSEGRVLRKLKN